jgi:hypothetical protein
MLTGDAVQHCADLALYVSVLKSCSTRLGTDHNVCGFREISLIASEIFPEQPFDPVTRYCIAGLFSDGETKSSPC